jgi:predicted glutamine amidotransferase
MCRWLAYSGAPVDVDRLLLAPKNSLIAQSQNATMGATVSNGDGFGLGWYGERDTPAVFHSIEPAWSDRNLRELAAAVRSRMFFAHIRAATATPIQKTNCHPFRYGRWLWMHNGFIREFARIKRDLTFDVAPSLFPFIEGSTDSELFFYLALTLGLETDPPGAVARAVHRIEEIGRAHGVENPMRMSVATTDGVRLWAFRYSTEGNSPSLFFSTDVPTLRATYPDNPDFAGYCDDARLIVSEPLGDLRGVWNEVPESSYGVVQRGAADSLHAFVPVPA